MVEQLVRFLGVSYDKAQLESMVEHCHQLIDQCCNAEALPVGRGTCNIQSAFLRWNSQCLISSRTCRQSVKIKIDCKIDKLDKIKIDKIKSKTLECKLCG